MRRHIPKAVKEIALHMSLTVQLPDKKIREYTGISIGTLKRLRQTFRQTGTTVRTPICDGRPRQLDALDVQVCIATLLLLSGRNSPAYCISS